MQEHFGDSAPEVLLVDEVVGQRRGLDQSHQDPSRRQVHAQGLGAAAEPRGVHPRGDGPQRASPDRHPDPRHRSPRHDPNPGGPGGLLRVRVGHARTRSAPSSRRPNPGGPTRHRRRRLHRAVPLVPRPQSRLPNRPSNRPAGSSAVRRSPVALRSRRTAHTSPGTWRSRPSSAPPSPPVGADTLGLLFSGKLDLFSIPALGELRRLGLVQARPSSCRRGRPIRAGCWATSRSTPSWPASTCRPSAKR